MPNKNYHAADRLQERYGLNNKRYYSVCKGLINKVKTGRVKNIKPAENECYEVKAKYGKVIYRFIVNNKMNYIITFLPNDNEIKKIKSKIQDKSNKQYQKMYKKMEIRKKKRY